MLHRHKGHIAIAPRNIHHGLLLITQAFEVIEVRMTICISDLTHHWQAVAAQHLHGNAAGRFAILDGLHEYFLRTVVGLFDQQAEIGHHYHASITQRAAVRVVPLRLIAFQRAIGLRIPCLRAHQKNAAFISGTAVQILGQIQRFIVRITGFRYRDTDDLAEAFGDIGVLE